MPVLILRSSAAPTSFSTTFSGSNESPLSEGGNWARAANSWQDLRIQSGVAKPTAFNDSTTDDNYSLCQAYSPNDADVVATVYLQNGATSEYEILLRMADTSTTASGYECLYKSDASVQLVRWNGSLGLFTPFETFTESVRSTLADGDQIRGTAVGTTISMYWRRPSSSLTWTLICQGTDNTYSTGKSGIGFFLHSGSAALDDVGFTDFSVSAA